MNNDWWRGEGPTGQQGIFPSNYVRKIESHAENEHEKRVAYPPPQAPYGYQQYPPQQYPGYGQPQYQPQPQPQPQEVAPENKSSRLGEFGKNYGKTFVNATAW